MEYSAGLFGNDEIFSYAVFCHNEYALSVNYLSNSQRSEAIYRKMRSIYPDRVFPENLGMVLMELLAKLLKVHPSLFFNLRAAGGVKK